MRTLKKSLALVLCLAMMVGLCAVGASAVTIDDYKDKDKIQYQDAVTLLSALGVLEGYPDKTFKPEGELNRAEGAAIMTRLLTKATPTGTSSFTDMGNYAWAQPYVKFCEDFGIINGYGDGRFGPADKLTTTQFAKMLICALGYDAKAEGFVDDPAWAINVTKKVTGLNLADGLAGYNPNAAVTRETAAQLAFNTLFQTMVYSDGISYQIFGGLNRDGSWMTLKNGAPVPNTSYDYTSKIDGVMQFIEASFPNIKVDDGEDAYAVPMRYWWSGKNAQDKVFNWNKVIAETFDCDVLARYAEGISGVSDKTLYADANFTKAVANTVELYENGEQVNDAKVVPNSAARPYVMGNYGGAEALLLDCDDDGIADRLVVKYPYLAKVIAVQEDKDEETRSISLKIFTKADTSVVAVIDCDEFEVNDFVLVYAWGAIAETQKYVTEDFEDTILEIKPVTAKNGTLTKVGLAAGATATSLTVGGESFPIGSKFLANLGPADKQPVACDKDLYELQVGMTVYSNFGYALGVISDAEAYGDYIFVVDAYKKHVDSAFGGPGYDYAGYVKQDATPVEAIIGQRPSDPPVDPMTWYYPIIGASSTRFIKPSVTEAEINGLYRNTPALDNAYKIVTDAKTNFVFWTNTGFSAVTGIKNVPEYKDTMKAYALIPGEGGHAVAVFIDARGCTPLNGGGTPIYIISELAKTKEVDGDGTTQVYTYSAIVDGKLKTVKSLVALTTGDLGDFGFVVPYYNAKGYISSVEILTKDSPIVQLLKVSFDTVDYKDGTLTLDGGKDGAYFVCTDTATVYVINRAGTKVSTITPEAMTGLKDAYISAISVSALDRTLQVIYFDKYNY